MRGYSLVSGDSRRGTARDIQAQGCQLLTERLQGHMMSAGGGAERLRANNIKDTRGLPDEPMPREVTRTSEAVGRRQGGSGERGRYQRASADSGNSRSAFTGKQHPPRRTMELSGASSRAPRQSEQITTISIQKWLIFRPQDLFAVSQSDVLSRGAGRPSALARQSAANDPPCAHIVRLS